MWKSIKIDRLLGLEWGAAVLGLLGAGLLAVKIEASGWGWVCFLLSNCCWVMWGALERRWSIVVMQIGFTPTSLIGIYRWLM